jgi:hypothetical protein
LLQKNFCLLTKKFDFWRYVRMAQADIQCATSSTLFMFTIVQAVLVVAILTYLQKSNFFVNKQKFFWSKPTYFYLFLPQLSLSTVCFKCKISSPFHTHTHNLYLGELPAKLSLYTQLYSTSKNSEYHRKKLKVIKMIGDSYLFTLLILLFCCNLSFF